MGAALRGEEELSPQSYSQSYKMTFEPSNSIIKQSCIIAVQLSLTSFEASSKKKNIRLVSLKTCPS